MHIRVKITRGGSSRIESLEMEEYLKRVGVKQNAFFLDCIQRALADEEIHNISEHLLDKNREAYEELAK